MIPYLEKLALTKNLNVKEIILNLIRILLHALAFCLFCSTKTINAHISNPKSMCSIKYQQQEGGEEAKTPHRPKFVLDSLKQKRPIYYFGIGSNLSRKKLESRSICGSKIRILSMEAAVVPGYRLAFNMRALPPLEPGMGSLEPVTEDSSDSSGALYPYCRNECHGALIQLDSEEYEKIMRSEGISHQTNNKTDVDPNLIGYEEIVVTAQPYGKNRPPVQAVALRARPHFRLKRDPCPSKRYMQMLRDGSKELGIDPVYQQWLNDHPVQIVPKIIQRIAIRNVLWTFFLGRRKTFSKFIPVNKLQSWLLWQVYMPTVSQQRSITSNLSLLASYFITFLILFPGCVLGTILLQYYKIMGGISPMLKSMLEVYG